MKKWYKYACMAVMAVVMPCCMFFAGCQQSVVIKDITFTESRGLEDVYTITYSDGTTRTISIKNGKDGTNGTNGADGDTLSITEAFEKYKELHPGATYEDFLRDCMDDGSNTQTAVVARCLSSAMKLYTEYRVDEVTSYYPPRVEKTVKRSGGSAVIYKIEDEYTYIITNCHVVYNQEANADNNNGSKIAQRIVGYLYGSEGANGLKSIDGVTQKDADGYPIYEYGAMGVELEYVGSSVEKDIALVRGKTADLKAINPEISAATFADEYYVGESAIAIGNPEGQGLSVTEGIVSVDSEYIYLQIDETVRAHRSMRIDTAIYHGSSGGGLFNEKGELIGITNAGDGTDENVNYAVPLPVVKNTVENIMYYYQDGDPLTQGGYKITMGLTVNIENSKYVYDADTGMGDIVEEIIVSEVLGGSIAESLGILVGDQLVSFQIGATEYMLDRSYQFGDLLLNVRAGDIIKMTVLRDGAERESSERIIATTDLVALV